MSRDDAVLIGFWTWASGVAGWIIAAAFDYVADHNRYKIKKTSEQATYSATHQGQLPDAATLEANLRNQGFTVEAGQSIFRTAMQPLLVLAIILLPTFRAVNFSGQVAHAVTACAMFLVIALTIVHEAKGKDDWIKWYSYRSVIIFAWLSYVGICLWLALAALP